jgi:glutamate/tyrosine decarboxylase-like PLP-dependent enzyme
VAESGCRVLHVRGSRGPVRDRPAARSGLDARHSALSHQQWDPDWIRGAGDRVVRWLADFYGSLDGRPITPSITPAEVDALFAEALPRAGIGFEATFDEVEAKVVANSLLIPHPRYYGLMNPTPLIPAVLADVVVSGLNQNSAAWSHSPAGTAVEKRVVRWLCDLVEYPDDAFGTFCSGGSVANLTGLLMAIADRLPAAMDDGLHALAGRPVFYVSAEAHYSFRKAARILGLGASGLRAVPTDARARADVGALRAMIRDDRARGLLPFALVGIAGTTSSGSVDPLGALADVAAAEGLWYHVDAAWGSGALLSARHRGRLAEIERADSITFDPHKWFFMPMGSGAILTRHRAAMLRAFSVDAVYIPSAEDERVDFRRYGVVGSKRFDALKLWVALKTLGADWFAAVIDRHMELTDWLAARIAEAPEWELLVPPDLNILCFRCRPAGVTGPALDAFQEEVVATLVREGDHWLSTTEVRGVRAIRWMALSPALEAADLARSWEALVRTAERLVLRP